MPDPDPPTTVLDAQSSALIAQSPTAIAVVDRSDVIVEWNGQAEVQFGHRRTAALGRTLAELLVPDELQAAHRAALAAYLDDGDADALPTGLTVPARRADGTVTWTSVTITPIAAPDGQPLFTTWLGRMHRHADERRSDPAATSQLEALVNNISDVITVLDAHGNWISSTGAGSRLLGWEPDIDPEGGLYALIHPDDIEPTRRALGEVLAGTRTNDEPIDIRVMDSDGRYHVLETVAENLTDHPQVGGLALTSRDVTAARAASAALESRTKQLLALVEAFSDGVLVVDRDSRVLFANDALVEMFGIPHSAESLTGRSIDDVYSEISPVYADDVTAIELIGRRYAEDHPTYDEVVIMLDGRVLERDSIPIAYGDGEREHLWVHRDVTAREELTRRRSDQLDDTRRAHDLAEERNRALLDLTEMRSQFVATVSHELRTPLASIVSFADLLKGDLHGDELAEQRSFVDAIDRNAKRLLRLVNDLLLLRQLEAGALPLQYATASVSDLVRGAVRALEPLAAARRQRLTASVEPGPDIDGDLGRLDQVLVNLISNAVKYTPEAGSITVRADHDEGWWSIVVTDDGVGIPADELPNLFSHFYRGAYSSSGASGTGLGLVITKAVVEMHGGTVHVDSTVDVGTTVTVRLPLGAPSDAAMP